MSQKKPARNWKEYNQRLVQRGEILLAIECLSDWQQELQKMNEGKRGRPFLYPHSLMLFWAILRFVFRLPYRQLEGLARKLSKLVSIPVPDYSTLCLRIPKLDIDPNLGYKPSEEEVVIAVDATGIKVTKKGSGREGKGYVKIHVAVDVQSKQVVSLEVTDDKTMGRCCLLWLRGHVRR